MQAAQGASKCDHGVRQCVSSTCLRVRVGGWKAKAPQGATNCNHGVRQCASCYVLARVCRRVEGTGTTGCRQRRVPLIATTALAMCLRVCEGGWRVQAPQGASNCNHGISYVLACARVEGTGTTGCTQRRVPLIATTASAMCLRVRVGGWKFYKSTTGCKQRRVPLIATTASAMCLRVRVGGWKVQAPQGASSAGCL